MYCAGYLEKGTGHCGTANTALALALRAQRVCCRVVQGTYPQGGVIHIRSQIWVDGIGWMHSDATVRDHMQIASASGCQQVTTTGPGLHILSNAGFNKQPLLSWHCHGASRLDFEESHELLRENWKPGNKDSDYFRAIFNRHAEKGSVTAPKLVGLFRELANRPEAPSFQSEQQELESVTYFTDLWNDVFNASLPLSFTKFMKAMDCVERSSCHSDQGYCMARVGKASAAYAPYGVEVYHANKGVSPLNLETLVFEPVASAAWIEFSRENGVTTAGQIASNTHITLTMTCSERIVAETDPVQNIVAATTILQ